MTTPQSEPDNELFELCKEVSERTEWLPEDCDWWFYSATDLTVYDLVKHDDYYKFISVYEPKGYVPLYTSDYLLEKLTNVTLDHDTDNSQDGSWSAKVLIPENNTKDKVGELEFADTPLKALLKLTIALHRAGELK